MAAVFLSIKDTVASKFTPDCLKAKTDELKDLAKEKLGETKLDPNNPAHKDKITEWEAGWNVTNAIQVKLNDKPTFRQDIIYLKTCGIELIDFGKNNTNLLGYVHRFVAIWCSPWRLLGHCCNGWICPYMLSYRKNLS